MIKAKRISKPRGRCDDGPLALPLEDLAGGLRRGLCARVDVANNKPRNNNAPRRVAPRRTIRLVDER